MCHLGLEQVGDACDDVTDPYTFTDSDDSDKDSSSDQTDYTHLHPVPVAAVLFCHLQSHGTVIDYISMEENSPSAIDSLFQDKQGHEKQVHCMCVH